MSCLTMDLLLNGDGNKPREFRYRDCAKCDLIVVDLFGKCGADVHAAAAATLIT